MDGLCTWVYREGKNSVAPGAFVLFHGEVGPGPGALEFARIGVAVVRAQQTIPALYSRSASVHLRFARPASIARRAGNGSLPVCRWTDGLADRHGVARWISAVRPTAARLFNAQPSDAPTPLLTTRWNPTRSWFPPLFFSHTLHKAIRLQLHLCGTLFKVSWCDNWRFCDVDLADCIL